MYAAVYWKAQQLAGEHISAVGTPNFLGIADDHNMAAMETHSLWADSAVRRRSHLTGKYSRISAVQPTVKAYWEIRDRDHSQL